MQYRELGKSGISVSVVGLGTWAIGGWAWGGNDDNDSIAAIRRGLDDGINLIDTAPAYGLGHSEEVVGKAIKGRPRDKIVIATKCGLVWHTDKGTFSFEEYGKRVHRYLGPESVRYELEQSLKLLGVDFIDLYQTHWPDVTTPIADTMGELVRLKDAGKIRAIGVSNCDIPPMKEYLAVGRIESNQPPYSMLDRGIEGELLEFCRKNSIGVLPYSPLAQGLLTGKMTPERKFKPGDWRASRKRFSPESIRRVNAMLDKFAPIREKHKVNQTQLTIGWTIARPGITSALVGVRNPQQAADIAKGGDMVLSKDELARMDKIIAELGSVD
ncbi:MAG TPA: aldo/keto reductase [Planctomycetota bacterium]|nr:aldo/keto reductase [Planctomycetota bacterium]